MALVSLVFVVPACGPREERPDPTSADPQDSLSVIATSEATPAGRGDRRPREIEGRQPPPLKPEARSAYDTAMIEGAAALYSGRFDEARRQYLIGMELRPEKSAPALGALRTMGVEGRGEERGSVEATLKRQIALLEAEPRTHGAALLLSARLATALQDPVEALDRALLAVQKLPNLGVAWRVLGEAAMMAERWTQARVALKRATELGLSAKAGTWERLADILDEMGDLQGAEDAARRALELTGSDPHARRRRLNLLGVVLKHRGKLDASMETIRAALLLEPNDPAVLHNLASLQEARGEVSEALTTYERALSQVSAPMTRWRLGRLLLSHDRKDEALAALKRAAAQMDRWTWPRSTRWLPAYDVGRLYAQHGRERDAIGWFEDSLREAQTSESVQEVRSWLAYTRSQATAGMEDPDTGVAD